MTQQRNVVFYVDAEFVLRIRIALNPSEITQKVHTGVQINRTQSSSFNNCFNINQREQLT